MENPSLSNLTGSAKLLPKALLVEDDKITQMIHHRYLEQLGYQVDLAETGREAIKRVEAVNYNVMLLDLGLPDILGELVIMNVRLHEIGMERHLKIVVVTAHGDEGKLQECRDKGADEAFIKPLSLEQLKQTLKSVCH